MNLVKVLFSLAGLLILLIPVVMVIYNVLGAPTSEIGFVAFFHNFTGLFIIGLLAGAIGCVTWAVRLFGLKLVIQYLFGKERS